MPAAPAYFSVCVAVACTYYSTVGNGLHSYVHCVCMCIVCRCVCVCVCVLQRPCGPHAAILMTSHVRGCACDVTSHVLSFVSVKKAAYVYCYCISLLWERLVAPSDARIVSRKEAA